MGKGKIFVFSGASGVGKSTVLKRVMEARKDLAFSVSATTRPPREGEVEGVHYYFVTREKFEDMIARGEFIEYDEHAANLYGTPLPQMVKKLETSHVALDIEPAGAYLLKAKRPDAVLIFIMPLPRRSWKDGCGVGETPAMPKSSSGWNGPKWEMEQRVNYDYVVVNDDADACAAEILNIIGKIAGEE